VLFLCEVQKPEVVFPKGGFSLGLFKLSGGQDLLFWVWKNFKSGFYLFFFSFLVSATSL